MIPKSRYRFSQKLMLQEKGESVMTIRRIVITL